MAAAFVNHKYTKSFESSDSLGNKLVGKGPVVPPEREWEDEKKLGMLMLNG
jgi:hypothetical protein